MTSVNIEVVDIRKFSGDGNLKASADVKIGDSVIVKGFSVMNGKNGLFVTMPRKASKDGRWFDTSVPVNGDVKREIEDKIMEAFDRETDGVR